MPQPSSAFADAFALTGQRALITGGGTGIGFGIAQAFVAAGAEVLITGRREDVLREACAALGEAASYTVADGTEPETPERLAASAGQITILVNNAGTHLKKTAVETSADEFRSVLETHVVASFAMSKAFAPQMIERGGGCILCLASMTSYIGMPLVVAYTAAKTAIVGVVRGLTSDLAKDNVRVNAAAPGWIESPMTDKAFAADPERKRKVLSRTPMGRMGQPEDIGWAAVYLCSPAAKFITGAILTVDGGAHMGF